MFDYLPELFVRSMARCREFDTRNKTGAVQQYTDYLCNDKVAYTRDLPLLFEYETEMHGIDYSYDAADKDLRNASLHLVRHIWPSAEGRQA